MRSVEEIIKAKRSGEDCSEEESAEIKGWLREYRMPGQQHIEAEIQLLFPLEYGEWLDEVE